MRKGATTHLVWLTILLSIVALRNEKGSYNDRLPTDTGQAIVALRNEKGSYNCNGNQGFYFGIVALRNEKGSYNVATRS